MQNISTLLTLPAAGGSATIPSQSSVVFPQGNVVGQGQKALAGNVGVNPEGLPQDISFPTLLAGVVPQGGILDPTILEQIKTSQAALSQELIDYLRQHGVAPEQVLLGDVTDISDVLPENAPALLLSDGQTGDTLVPVQTIPETVVTPDTQNEITEETAAVLLGAGNAAVNPQQSDKATEVHSQLVGTREVLNQEASQHSAVRVPVQPPVPVDIEAIQQAQVAIEKGATENIASLSLSGKATSQVEENKLGKAETVKDNALAAIAKKTDVSATKSEIKSLDGLRAELQVYQPNSNTVGQQAGLLSYQSNAVLQGSQQSSGTAQAGQVDGVTQPSFVLTAGEQKVAELQQQVVDYGPKAQHAKPSAATEQVSVKIAQAVQQGDSKIEIRLEPAALGKVQVQIELAHDGKANVLVVADKQETLDMLRQDARALERALNDAGIKTDTGSLNFSNKSGNNFAGGESNAQGYAGNNLGGDMGEEGTDEYVAAYQVYDSNRALDIVA